MDRNAVGVARVCLVKEASSAPVYLAYGDTKFHVASPERMDAMGLRWDKVEVVPDGSLADLVAVELGAAPPVRPSDVYFSPFDIDVAPGNMSKEPEAIVRRDVLLAGMISPPYWNCPYNDDTGSHQTEGPWVEDIQWELTIDPDFVERMYGPDGLSNALVDTVLPGHVPPASGSGTTGGVGRLPVRLPFGDMPPDPAGKRYATVGAFSAPGPVGASRQNNVPLGALQLHVELNCWHVDTHFGKLRDVALYQASGRGPAPSGWVKVFRTDPVTWFLWTGVVDDCWWPWNPNRPDSWDHDLSNGEAVLVCGTLWQDTAHESTPGPWESTVPGQGGWLEMHPPDWMHRFHVSAPLRTASTIALPAGNSRSLIAPMMAPISPTPGKRVVWSGSAVDAINHRYDAYVNASASVDHHTITNPVPYEVMIDTALKPDSGSVHNLFAATVIADWTLVDKGKDKEKESKEGHKDKDGLKDNLIDKSLAGAEKQDVVSGGSDYAAERAGGSGEPPPAGQTPQDGVTGAAAQGSGYAHTFIAAHERPEVGPGS